MRSWVISSPQGMSKTSPSDIRPVTIDRESCHVPNPVESRASKPRIDRDNVCDKWNRFKRRQQSADKDASSLMLRLPPRSDGSYLSTEWQSEEDEIYHDSRHETRQMGTSQHNHHLAFRQSPVSSPLKNNAQQRHSTRRKSSGRSEQRWINHLERNNEELMNQISVITADLSATRRDLTTDLISTKAETEMLRQQLEALRETHQQCQERHRTEVAMLQQREQDAKSAGRHASYSRVPAEEQTKRQPFHGERETLIAKLKARDAEVLRLRRRNAELAEQILDKKSLEMYAPLSRTRTRESC